MMNSATPGADSERGDGDFFRPTTCGKGIWTQHWDVSALCTPFARCMPWSVGMLCGRCSVSMVYHQQWLNCWSLSMGVWWPRWWWMVPLPSEWAMGSDRAVQLLQLYSILTLIWLLSNGVNKVKLLEQRHYTGAVMLVVHALSAKRTFLKNLSTNLRSVTKTILVCLSFTIYQPLVHSSLTN